CRVIVAAPQRMGNFTVDGDEPELCPDGSRGYFLSINQHAPLDWAVPMYGYVMPILVIFTTTTNLFIMVVLSQKHLRTPTNIILLTMALTDLLTGWTSIPWFVYYYTLGGYNAYDKVGMSDAWCKSHMMLHEILPSFFHTTTMWLTVFLAIQRYVYVCVPNSIHQYCTPRTTRLCIIGIFLCCASIYLPEIFGHYRMVAPVEPVPGSGVYINGCFQCISPWLNNFMVLYEEVLPVFRAAIHFTPCILLLIFTRKLAQTIKAAEVRKRSWATDSMFERRGSSITPRCSASSSGRSMYATNRMLAVICTVFFLLEIPAGLLYLIQLLFFLPYDILPVHVINRFIILRTLAIIISSPIQFFIYCSMSEQFRLTARQLFTSRLLFVAQAQATFHGGKRYSLILVDVETFEAKRKQSAARRGLLAKASNAFLDREIIRTANSSTMLLPLTVDGPPSTTITGCAKPKRKVGRQVSFPDEDTHERDRLDALYRGQYSLRSSLRRTSLTRAFRRTSKTMDVLDVVESRISDDPNGNVNPAQRIAENGGLAML
ncbi:hypothetical protein PMAYCL1PPCAC_31641, partial [Pristionchus mayeri]